MRHKKERYVLCICEKVIDGRRVQYEIAVRPSKMKRINGVMYGPDGSVVVQIERK